MERALDYHPRKTKRERVPLSRQAALGFKILNFISLVLIFTVALADLWARRLDPWGGYGVLLNDLLLAISAVAIPSILLFLWLFRLLKYVEMKRPQQSLIFCLIALAIAMGTIFLNTADVPFHLAFAFSRPAFEKAVAAFRMDPTKTMENRTIGCLPVEGVRLDGPQTSIFIQGAGFDVTHAIIFRLGGRPPSCDSEPLGHDWYFTRSFMPP